jgi:hypothetical protein
MAFMNGSQSPLIRGLPLPGQFISCVESGIFHRQRGPWQLRKPFDAYGNMLETELGLVYETPEKIRLESEFLSQYFSPAEDDLSDIFCDTPGFIPFITDFSQILAFGTAGDGAPFVFDYRDGAEPTVIWWANAYWHRVAPSFTAFLDLFRI